MERERFEVQREVAAHPEAIFDLLRDPRGHVAIDSSGMLQSADGDRVRNEGDSFVVHMDREALNDYPLDKYDVTVIITQLAHNELIEWTITASTVDLRPPDHFVGVSPRNRSRGRRSRSLTSRVGLPRAGSGAKLRAKQAGFLTGSQKE